MKISEKIKASILRAPSQWGSGNPFGFVGVADGKTQ